MLHRLRGTSPGAQPVPARAGAANLARLKDRCRKAPVRARAGGGGVKAAADERDEKRKARNGVLIRKELAYQAKIAAARPPSAASRVPTPAA